MYTKIVEYPTCQNTCYSCRLIIPTAQNPMPVQTTVFPMGRTLFAERNYKQQLVKQSVFVKTATNCTVQPVDFNDYEHDLAHFNTLEFKREEDRLRELRRLREFYKKTA